MKEIRFAASILVVVLALALAGCAGKHPSLTAAQAKARYQPIVNALAKELAAKFHLTWRPYTSADVQDNGGGCTWYAATLRADTWLGKTSWSPVIAVVNRQLTRSGFDKAATADATGGWTGVESTDSHHAKVTVIAKGYTKLQFEVPVKGSC